MNKSDLRNLIKNTIEEILKERIINVDDKKDIPKDLEDGDVVNIGIDSDDTKKTSSKLKNIDKKFKSKLAKPLSKDFYS